MIFSINSFYASNAAPFDKQVAELYFVTLFGLFTTNYSIKEFLQFIIFPFLSFGPLLFLFLSKKINSLKNIDNEFLLILILSFLGIVGIAFAGGPIITGKNLIRLSNFIFPSLIIFINLIFIEKINVISKKSYLILSLIILFIWSLHPTFSKIKFFGFLKIIFN